MFKQNLKINEVLIYIKKCTKKIGVFWSIMASTTVSREHISNLLEISVEISDMLKKIRSFLKNMNSVDNTQSSCQSLYFYLAYFFIMVLRDSAQG